MFIDKVRIFVKGRQRRRRLMSFRREAHVPRAVRRRRDGGHGGATWSSKPTPASSLIDYRFKHHFRATRGTHGKGRRCTARTGGDDLVLKVPVGTVVREYFEDARETGELIADLTHDGERVVVASSGGIGGRGNIHFVTPTRRALRSPNSRAGPGGLDRARDEAHGRCCARRHAVWCGQVVAHLQAERGAPEGCGLPVYNAGAQSRCVARSEITVSSRCRHSRPHRRRARR